MPLSLFPIPRPQLLVVDDDAIIRLLLRKVLEGEGYGVREAASAEAAFLLLHQESIDLILLDILMPGMDGPTFCEEIQTVLPQPPPVLMMTGLEDDESIDRSYKAGAVDYISKPLRWPVLKNRISYIIQAHRSRMELELTSKRYEMFLDFAANGICGLNKHGQITYANPAALLMLGYTYDEMCGQSCRQIFQIAQPGGDGFTEDACPFFTTGREYSFAHYEEVRMRRKDGSSFAADFRANPIRQQGAFDGGVATFQDITKRKESEDLARHQANHDYLTKVPNRTFLLRRMPQALALAERDGRLLSLLFIDLDHFKPINDQYGHKVGDKVLMEVANRLGLAKRGSDSLCRLGGDEFVILLEGTVNLEGATQVAERVIELLNQPFHIDGHVCSLGASIGISIYPQDATNPDELLTHADIAMYEAKKSGRNCWRVYKKS